MGIMGAMSTNDSWRNLSDNEILLLKQQHNRCNDWSLIRLKGDLPEGFIRYCSLEGEILLDHPVLEERDIQDRVFLSGLENSTLRDCRIEGNGSVINVNYIRGYHLQRDTFLANIQEMIHSGNSSFGQGFLRNDEEVGAIEPGNEAGYRWILPFGTMLPPDIRLWMSLRGNSRLQQQFCDWTSKLTNPDDNKYAVIARGTVLKNCCTIKNIQISGTSFISGAIRLEELTIQGSEESPVIIEEGSDLRWGILREGVRVSNSMAEHFYLGAHSNLTKGARYIHSCLSENSTISCCEVISVFTGAFHEQHHNNSFLIASTLEGQSNVAAGATIGSNHNSRSADGEIRAGRGFWPALNLSLKHNSRFASFTLIARGQYPNELHIGLPFSLVSQTESELQIMPAYWQQYNLYALARNSWKFQNRDKRKTADYLIETHWLAPDTVTEIREAIRFLQDLLNVSQYKQRGEEMEEILLGNEFMENSNRPVRILKPHEAIRTYQRLLNYHFALSLLEYNKTHKKIDLEALNSWKDQCSEAPEDWTNLAGTPVSKQELSSWEERIGTTELQGWQDLHNLYQDWIQRYPEERLKHSICCLQERDKENLNLHDILKSALEWEQIQWEGVRKSREKDVVHPFRHITYDSEAEKKALLVSLDDDHFIQDFQNEMQQRVKCIEKLIGSS